MVDRVLVEGSPQIGGTAPAQTTIGTTASLILATNQKRKGFIVQNTGLTVIKLTFSSTMPTQTVYDVGLKACSVADDGTGGTYIDSAWVGQVNAISSGAGGTFVSKEFTTGSPNWNLASDGGNLML